MRRRGSSGYVPRSDATQLLRRNCELAVKADQLQEQLAKAQEEAKRLREENDSLRAQLRDALGEG